MAPGSPISHHAAWPHKALKRLNRATQASLAHSSAGPISLKLQWFPRCRPLDNGLSCSSWDRSDRQGSDETDTAASDSSRTHRRQYRTCDLDLGLCMKLWHGLGSHNLGCHLQQPCRSAFRTSEWPQRSDSDWEREGIQARNESLPGFLARCQSALASHRHFRESGEILLPQYSGPLVPKCSPPPIGGSLSAPPS
jgi:hypothetical protein